MAGGNAKDTKRTSTSIGQFVRKGQSKGVVCLHLYNGGDNAYRNDFYGDQIILERTITTNNSGPTTIKGSSGVEAKSGSKYRYFFYEHKTFPNHWKPNYIIYGKL